ncbi:cbb3-type cytochrome oxidase assembly protein CcoS [Rhizobium sp. 25PS6]|uniref:cbb3-type cytochrome oxidase assembly protein CcoS n=1 Tax=Rhizobium TaxID=379 RepID=UPI001038F054|nr:MULTISPECIES: cbb3-type cytochrome oxidase assembly protein CcoS [Rhizobium]MBY3186705.1 cbb3-type cytochrome oxidase assembly protein CcoS [Rhizobium laguerreae]MBY3225416.1 cbb3-type cytochrome oxidase assembly protein CcoS [Rhizobium laguerreae]MBY3237811.1 cbb3-type cytochrome oxidase assembly protein CcoS [Rhizobium laguerreae]MBY3380937.1 cbb3-type cytochrome oxidase assembly protein CcoS [Rhizobium laguerreae]MBY5814551.1 cbb3-type cytochrome oxidase assembly protein CcoS [Rhizobium 
MNMLIYLIPIALFMGGVGLAAFLWSLKSGQYEDLEGAAWRAIADDEPQRPDLERGKEA